MRRPDAVTIARTRSSPSKRVTSWAPRMSTPRAASSPATRRPMRSPKVRSSGRRSFITIVQSWPIEVSEAATSVAM